MAQLRMRFRATPADFTVPALPEGYTLGTLNPDTDIMGWIETCTDGLDTGAWTPADFQRAMLDPEGLSPDRIFVVRDVAGRVVATATAWPRSDTQGYLHMVCARPECRGQHLGAIVVQAVMDWFAAHGVTEIRLHTDDFRLAAIKTYLRIGFLPELYDFDMPARWKEIYRKLDVDLPVYYCRWEEGALR